LHPFDIKAALLAKHAQHVVLIHFPIALFIAGAASDFLAQGTSLSPIIHEYQKKRLAKKAFRN